MAEVACGGAPSGYRSLIRKGQVLRGNAEDGIHQKVEMKNIDAVPAHRPRGPLGVCGVYSFGSGGIASNGPGSPLDLSA